MRFNPLYFARADRRGLLLLFLIISAAAFVMYSVQEPEEPMMEKLGKERQEVDSFLAEVKELKTRRRANKTVNYNEKTYRLHRFNPNTADSSLLASLGLKPWQVRNIMKYRRVGGMFRTANDFSRVYGLSSTDFLRLKPYITIPASSTTRQNSHRKEASVAYTNNKFDEIVKLDLNKVDTTLLKRIPGIGSYYARRIVDYGARLGGYVSTTQLREIKGLPKEIEQWFNIDNNATKKLDINTSSFKQLLRHPYLSYSQVSAISKAKWSEGPIKDLQRLRMLPEFTSTDIERLSPYLSF